MTVDAATFASISTPGLADEGAAAALTRLLPGGFDVASAGVLVLHAGDVEVGLDSGRLIVGFHGQTLGEFGAGAALIHRQPRQTPAEGFFATFCCVGTSFYDCTGAPRAFEECRLAGGTPEGCCSEECTLEPDRESRGCRARPTPTATPTATPGFEELS